MSATTYMPHVAFDTLAYANKLKAVGVDPKIAEAHAELQATVLTDLTTNQLATKKDLQEVRFILETKINYLDNKTDKLKNELLIKLGGITIACTTVLGSLLIILLHSH